MDKTDLTEENQSPLSPDNTNYLGPLNHIYILHIHLQDTTKKQRQIDKSDEPITITDGDSETSIVSSESPYLLLLSDILVIHLCN